MVCHSLIFIGFCQSNGNHRRCWCVPILFVFAINNLSDGRYQFSKLPPLTRCHSFLIPFHSSVFGFRSRATRFYPVQPAHNASFFGVRVLDWSPGLGGIVLVHWDLAAGSLDCFGQEVWCSVYTPWVDQRASAAQVMRPTKPSAAAVVARCAGLRNLGWSGYQTVSLSESTRNLAVELLG